MAKAKKQPKTTPSRPGDPPSSPRTPSSSSSRTSPYPAFADEGEVRVLLQEASRRYPSLIGDSAFVARVGGVDPAPGECKIWLSESSIVAASLTPDSLVSVSLAAVGSKCSEGFPLCSLSDECERQYGIRCATTRIDEAGDYFTLARVRSSSKVLKNEVQMSSNLFHTMGCPASGRTVFVYCVQSLPLFDLVNGDYKGHEKISNGMFICESKDLYLELLPIKHQGKPIVGKISETSSSAVSTQGRSENDLNSSPKTPLSQTNISSSSIHLAQGCQETTLSSSACRIADDNVLIIDDVLKDEISKEFLQICAVPPLYSRTLLHGNLVAIPIFSNFRSLKLCIFRITGPNRSSLASVDLDVKKNGEQQSCPKDQDSVVHVVDALVVNPKTKVHLYPSLDSADVTATKGSLLPGEIGFGSVETISQLNISKLGGLDKEYGILMDIITSSMKNSLSSLGLRATKGVLLHGPPGTGKTALARLCVRDAGVELLTVNGPEIIGQYYGESEQAMSKVFESAAKAAPAVVFIDDLDSIAPARTSGGEELSQRMVATLLNLMDGISRDNGLMVIAASSRPDSIEPALRRPGRLDREIAIGVPSPKQRFDILHSILTEMDHSLSDAEVQHIATATHGFVGADLAALCNEAGLICLRRYSKLTCTIDCNGTVNGFNTSGSSDNCLTNCEDSASSCRPDLHISEEIQLSSCLSETGLDSAESVNNKSSIGSDRQLSVHEDDVLKVSFEDFENARKKVRPSAMREVILEVPKVNWEDVGGQGEVKRQLMEAVEWPQKHEDAFRRIGTRPPTGVLLFGPPGCSKTLMARAVASEARLNFLAVKGPELFSKWVGESEKAVRSLFAKARANAPSIIFFDEIDALAVIRGKESDGVSVSDRVMSQLLVELDGLHQRVNVTVIAATNRPDKIDPALLRPGRFDRLVYVGPPNEADREEIFRIHLRKIPCSSDVSMKELAQLTDGCTGAVISSICREAALAALEENIDASVIMMKHLKDATMQARPSEVQAYEDLSSKFQRLVVSNRGSNQSESEVEPSTHSGGPRWLSIRPLLKSALPFTLQVWQRFFRYQFQNSR